MEAPGRFTHPIAEHIPFGHNFFGIGRRRILPFMISTSALPLSMGIVNIPSEDNSSVENERATSPFMDTTALRLSALWKYVLYESKPISNEDNCYYNLVTNRHKA